MRESFIASVAFFINACPTYKFYWIEEEEWESVDKIQVLDEMTNRFNIFQAYGPIFVWFQQCKLLFQVKKFIYGQCLR